MTLRTDGERFRRRANPLLRIATVVVVLVALFGAATVWSGLSLRREVERLRAGVAADGLTVAHEEGWRIARVFPLTLSTPLLEVAGGDFIRVEATGATLHHTFLGLAGPAVLSADSMAGTLRHEGAPPTSIRSGPFSLSWSATSVLFRAARVVLAGTPPGDARRIALDLGCPAAGRPITSTLRADPDGGGGPDKAHSFVASLRIDPDDAGLRWGLEVARGSETPFSAASGSLDRSGRGSVTLDPLGRALLSQVLRETVWPGPGARTALAGVIGFLGPDASGAVTLPAQLDHNGFAVASFVLLRFSEGVGERPSPVLAGCGASLP